MAQKAVSPSLNQQNTESISEKQALYDHMGDIEDILCEQIQDDLVQSAQEAFLRHLLQFCRNDTRPYIETIQKLSPDVSAKGVKWLQGIVDYYCQRAASMLSSLLLFKTS
jgi:hypothetical protein